MSTPVILTDPQSVYTFAIMHSMNSDTAIGNTFAEARDNPKIPKLVLMSAVLAGWLAAAAYMERVTGHS